MKSIEKMMNIKALWHDMHYKIGLLAVWEHNTQHEHSTSFKAQTANGFRYNFIGVYELAMQQIDWISDNNTLINSNNFPLSSPDQCSTYLNGESFQPNFRGNFSSSCIQNKPFKPYRIRTVCWWRVIELREDETEMGEFRIMFPFWIKAMVKFQMSVFSRIWRTAVLFCFLNFLYVEGLSCLNILWFLDVHGKYFIGIFRWKESSVRTSRKLFESENKQEMQ